jgi:tetratricopeptide (TPR) repeat protein
MNTNQAKSRIFMPALVALVACTLCWLSLLLPDFRLWGLNVWQELPRLWMTLATVIVIALVVLVSRKPEDKGTPEISGRWALFLVLTPVLFWLARAQTHFLGDGYQLLASLREGAESHKFWDQGISAITSGLHTGLSTMVDDPDLVTYQALSIGAGVLWLAGLWFYAGILYTTTKDKVLFVLVLLTGGMSLQFFGYVENYPLFLAFYGLTLLDGLRYLKTGRAFWVTLVLALATCLLHLFGMTLVPALAVLFLYRLWWQKRKHGSVLPLAVVAMVGVLVTVIAGYWYGTTNLLWFRFTVLPIVADRFTIDSYTMFSPAHLADMTNLLIVLIPGLLCLTPFLIGKRLKAWRSEPESAFLLTAAFSAVLAVLIMDPKLGMARDWDLFSFAGLPLALILVRLVATERSHTYAPQTLLSIAIIINLFFLSPRVAVQALPDPGIERFRAYLALDHARGRNARRALIDYYRDRGDVVSAQAEIQATAAAFPEHELAHGSLEYVAKGDMRTALSMNLEAIDLNPVYWDAYWGAGQCYLKLNRPDSAIAMFEIAIGLNPYNGVIHHSLGNALLRAGQIEAAKERMIRAVEIAPWLYAPYVSLATIYIEEGKPEEAARALDSMIALSATPAYAFRVVGDAYLEKGQQEAAREAYLAGVSRGLDTAYVKQRLR